MTMTNRLRYVDLYILIWGLLIGMIGFFAFNGRVALGALIGTTVSYINWVMFRVFVPKLFHSNSKSTLRTAILLGGKLVLLAGVIAAIFYLVPMNRFAFVLGFSTLILGIFTHAFREILRGEEPVAEEKR